jgi:hypothetical protein
MQESEGVIIRAVQSDDQSKEVQEETEAAATSLFDWTSRIFRARESQGEGLLQKIRMRIHDLMILHDSLGITGYEQNLHLSARIRQQLGNLAATHSRHHCIGDHQINFARILSSCFDRL